MDSLLLLEVAFFTPFGIEWLKNSAMAAGPQKTKAVTKLGLIVVKRLPPVSIESIAAKGTTVGQVCFVPFRQLTSQITQSGA